MQFVLSETTNPGTSACMMGSHHSYMYFQLFVTSAGQSFTISSIHVCSYRSWCSVV